MHTLGTLLSFISLCVLVWERETYLFAYISNELSCNIHATIWADSIHFSLNCVKLRVHVYLHVYLVYWSNHYEYVSFALEQLRSSSQVLNMTCVMMIKFNAHHDMHIWPSAWWIVLPRIAPGESVTGRHLLTDISWLPLPLQKQSRPGSVVLPPVAEQVVQWSYNGQRAAAAGILAPFYAHFSPNRPHSPGGYSPGLNQVFRPSLSQQTV